MAYAPIVQMVNPDPAPDKARDNPLSPANMQQASGTLSRILGQYDGAPKDYRSFMQEVSNQYIGNQFSRQNFTYGDIAEKIGVSSKTVQRKIDSNAHLRELKDSFDPVQGLEKKLSDDQIETLKYTPIDLAIKQYKQTDEYHAKVGQLAIMQAEFSEGDVDINSVREQVIRNEVLNSGNYGAQAQYDVSQLIQSGADYKAVMLGAQRAYFTATLQQYNGNITDAAKAAGVSKRTVERSIEKFSIDIETIRTTVTDDQGNVEQEMIQKGMLSAEKHFQLQQDMNRTGFMQDIPRGPDGKFHKENLKLDVGNNRIISDRNFHLN